jgi:hypothetical protein
MLGGKLFGGLFNKSTTLKVLKFHFETGEHCQIAVKVTDDRGNEQQYIKKLREVN